MDRFFGVIVATFLGLWFAAASGANLELLIATALVMWFGAINNETGEAPWTLWRGLYLSVIWLIFTYLLEMFPIVTGMSWSEDGFNAAIAVLIFSFVFDFAYALTKGDGLKSLMYSGGLLILMLIGLSS